MVRIGIVGMGFMGMIHYLAARRLKGARVSAICSRDPKKLAGDWRGGNCLNQQLDRIAISFARCRSSSQCHLQLYLQPTRPWVL